MWSYREPETQMINEPDTCRECGTYMPGSGWEPLCDDCAREAKERLALTPCSASVTVEFVCDECGEYEVIKSKGTLIQYCSSCGRLSEPSRIVSVGIKIDGVWKIKFLPNEKSPSTGATEKDHE